MLQIELHQFDPIPVGVLDQRNDLGTGSSDRRLSQHNIASLAYLIGGGARVGNTHA